MGLVEPLRYYEIVTTAAEKIAPGCAAAVRRSFAALRAASPAQAQRTLGLCQAPTVSRKIVLSFGFPRVTSTMILRTGQRVRME